MEISMKLIYLCKQSIICQMKFVSAFSLALFFLIQIVVFCGCSNVVEPITVTPASLTLTDTPEITTLVITEEDTSTPEEPTNTPVPLAAMANGEGILMEDYQIELELYEKEAGTTLATNDTDIVIQDMIDEVLLAQAAVAAGFEVDEAMVQQRIQDLGLSAQELLAWKKENGYSDDAFLRAMARSISAAWMRDRIVADVPQEAEQIHAQQFLLYNLTEAESVYAQLQAGIDFGTLAAEYDPITEGELGWFPRGYLTIPELDDVLFNLEPGEYSSIIETSLGFHIIQVIEREDNVPLSINAYKVVQLQYLTEWLEERREESDIILFLP